MATLTGQLVSASYPTLLKVATPPVDGTYKTIEDGSGVSSALQLSTLGVKSTGALQSVGATTLSSTLGVTGATTLSSLGVTGVATLASAVVTGSATVGTTLGVTGVLTATGGIAGTLTGASNGLHTGAVIGNTAGVHTGAVTGAVTGNATTATTLATSRTFQVSGAVTGSVVTFNGSNNVDIQTTITSHPRAVQTHLSTPVTTTCTANTFTLITGFSAIITPQSVTSRVRVDVTWNGYLAASFDRPVFQIMRGTPLIGMPTGFSSRTAGLAAVGGNATSPQTLHTVSFSFLDSPAATTAQAYYVGLLSNTANVVTTNSSATDTDNSSFLRTSSTIILTEIYT